ncbi:hypothetical protein [Evansella cellulosilytica]|uniref:Uncharacterized protein n=1 Tax=Evansella cellulosilytica (strain ATCC 21833 / DSM 2522 / FERM P-1141 / JCM 9156 / N-4) TaxID=649639 RepID=E6TVR9_EVAC2|nr:hypothetical protein [Evansella cellulosilytica]ADU32197.1 hypothetical protein Bcell_3964 [Evansella cellulosilytica DSM 2522]
MGKIDKRNRLAELPFSYRVNKANTVFLNYEGKQVKMIKGKDAEKFLKKINFAENENERQLIMAKITGNFKRGNEGNQSTKQL